MYAMAVFSALSSPALAIDPEIAAYSRCVSDESVRLSTGSDAADLIAKNAAVLCGDLLAKMVERNPNLFAQPSDLTDWRWDRRDRRCLCRTL